MTLASLLPGKGASIGPSDGDSAILNRFLETLLEYAQITTFRLGVSGENDRTAASHRVQHIMMTHLTGEEEFRAFIDRCIQQ